MISCAEMEESEIQSLNNLLELIPANDDDFRIETFALEKAFLLGDENRRVAESRF